MNSPKSFVKNLHRWILIAILAIIVVHNYYGEYCAHCEGYGWDGSVYYKDILINGLDQYTSGNISQYHTHRMLPFLIIHYIMRVLSLSFLPNNVMLVSSIINTCLLAISVWLFFGISRAKKWNWKTETLIFAFCFYNYHVLKFMGYCPVMTDMPTYTLSIALAYFFIKQNKTGLITTGLISIVVFPLLALMALLLLAFPNNSVGEYIPRKENAANPPSKIDKANYILNATMRAILTWWLPTAFVAYIFFRLYVRGMDNYQSVFVTRYPQNVWISVAGIIAYIIFYFYATMPLRADFATTLKQLYTRRRILAIALWLAIFVVVYTLPTMYGFKGKFSLVNEFAQICQFPATDVLIFIETHFLYLGIGFLFVLLMWKEICRETRILGIGAVLILMLSLVFLSDIETRKITCFYIFLLPIMGTLLEKKVIKLYIVYLIVATQLIYSAFWFNINTDGIAEAFATYDINVYLQMPAQRYYMFQGPWQSHQMYMLIIIIEICLLGILQLYLRNKSKNNNT